MTVTSITSKQRKLSSELTIEDQISTLKSLIKNPPQNSRVCEFTPELAEYILSEELGNLNINNRPRKTTMIIRYKKDMQADNWSLTGDTIKFGSDGFLKDGQNRLAACIQAQKPFTTHVLYGIDPNTFHHMDTGKNRAADDVLAMMGVKNSKKTAQTMKLLILWNKPDTSGGVDNQRIKDAYLNQYDAELLNEAVNVAQEVYRQTRFPLGHVAATFYKAVETGFREEIELFCAALINGTGKPSSGPVKLMKHINYMRNMHMKITSLQYSVLLSRAVHCFINKKSMTKADLNVTLVDRRMPMKFIDRSKG